MFGDGLAPAFGCFGEDVCGLAVTEPYGAPFGGLRE
jgi:hypothetical protein